MKANCDALEQNLQYISKLEHLLISMLDESEIAYRRNGGENRLPGLVSLSFPGKDGETNPSSYGSYGHQHFNRLRLR